MHMPTLDETTGRLVDLALVPLQRQRFQLRLAGCDDADWLVTVLNRESEAVAFEVDESGVLRGVLGDR